MSNNKTEIDTTFYDTLPPQMVDLRHLPPMQSECSKRDPGDIHRFNRNPQQGVYRKYRSRAGTKKGNLQWKFEVKVHVYRERCEDILPIGKAYH
jgi:hypothetical protein